MKKLISKGCTCEKCRSCCWCNPGWFGSIEEVKGAAKIKKMSVKKFAKEYLIREWWEEEDGVFIPAPRRNFKKIRTITSSEEDKRNGKGFVKATWGHNLIKGVACIFLDKNERCSIHKSKPKECREVFGCEKYSGNYRPKLLKYWGKNQKFVKSLK